MFAAMGSAASIEHVKNKSSACVEILRSLSHAISSYFGLTDYHRGHKEVDIYGDIQALCLDMETLGIHTFHPSRRVPPPTIRTKAGKVKKGKQGMTTGVRDVLEEGREALIEKGLFEKWKRRTGEMEDDEAAAAVDAPVSGSMFDDPHGTFNVDTSLDMEFGTECAFANVDDNE